MSVGPACPVFLVPPPYTQEQGKLNCLGACISQTVPDPEEGDPVGLLPSEVGLTQAFPVTAGGRSMEASQELLTSAVSRPPECTTWRPSVPPSRPIWLME